MNDEPESFEDFLEAFTSGSPDLSPTQKFLAKKAKEEKAEAIKAARKWQRIRRRKQKGKTNAPEA